VILFVVLGFFFVQQYFKVRELEKYRSDSIEEIKEIKRKAIKDNNQDIDSLNQIIIAKDVIIEQAKAREDSLLSMDARVIYIFREKRDEIKDFNAQEQENYWKNEFSN
jgi:hypothetical protein